MGYRGGLVTSNVLISIAIIVRDESRHLAECVASAADTVDEWIVYDTGSTDGTQDIARSLGCRVIQGEWREDFAWARNQALAEATGEWTLVLDADDRLIDGGLRELLASDPPFDAFELHLESPMGPGEAPCERAWVPRLFRTDRAVRFEHPIHELPRLDGLRVARAPARIVHVGYRDPADRRRKALRARRMLALLPEDSVHRAYHELRTCAVLEDYSGVLAAASRLEALCPEVPPDARVPQATALLHQGRAADAVEALVRATRDFPTHPDPWFWLIVASALAWLAAAKQASADPTRTLGAVSTLDHVPAVSAALVAAGLFSPDLLTSALGGADAAGPPRGGGISAGETRT